MTDDLIERLERGVLSCGLHDDNETELFEVDDANDTMDEAKDEIERLGSVIDATARHWLALHDKHPIQWEGAIDGAMAAACAEIEKLREALKEIKDLPNYRCVASDMRKIARAALGDPK